MTFSAKLLYATAIAFLLVLGGCEAMSAGLNQTYFQSIACGNEGKGVIDKVSIQYGKHQIIGGPARERYLPIHGVYGYTSLTSVIPDKTELYWVSADGVAHTESIPTK